MLPEILALHGRWRRKREAVVCGDQRQRWKDLSGSLNRVANALHARGVTRGDRVVVLMSNGLPMVHALLGMIRDAAAVAILVTENQRLRVDRMRARMAGGPGLLVLSGGEAPGWTSWTELLAGHGDEAPVVTIEPGDLPNIIYSSGTTGVPKGIAHTHRGRRDWAYDLAIALRYDGGARTLASIGLYSNISWMAMLCTLLASPPRVEAGDVPPVPPWRPRAVRPDRGGHHDPRARRRRRSLGIGRQAAARHRPAAHRRARSPLAVVVPRDSLPGNPNGMILKRELRAELTRA